MRIGSSSACRCHPQSDARTAFHYTLLPKLICGELRVPDVEGLLMGAGQ